MCKAGMGSLAQRPPVTTAWSLELCVGRVTECQAAQAPNTRQEEGVVLLWEAKLRGGQSADPSPGQTMAGSAWDTRLHDVTSARTTFSRLQATAVLNSNIFTFPALSSQSLLNTHWLL